MITHKGAERKTGREGSGVRIVIGADHCGYYLKNTLSGFIRQSGYEVIDVGAFSNEPSDYPEYARLVAEKIQSKEGWRGILICGSGVGASVAANKFRDIRAAVCHDTYSARQGVEDDAMNILCLGARVIGVELAKELVTAYLHAEFKDLERYRKRLSRIKEFEEQWKRKD
ncbi:Ribose 5-phosphate isomerase B [hydrothermal vent metagenome]|uniref:Ribose 5-phosphate isomerase B n=1 Tax=hydrothermal vent metagenome TaxID=652676 RepID=A0A3B1CLF9_9ZZZZ